MKIACSSIGMESERVYTTVRMDAYQTTTRKEGINDFLGSLTQNMGKNLKEGNKNTSKKVGYEEEGEEKVKEKDNAQSEKKLSWDDVKNRFNELSSLRNAGVNGVVRKANLTEQDSYTKLRQLCIKYLLFLLMGEKAKNLFEFSFTGLQNSFAETTTNTEMHYYNEEESTSFSATGKVITEDGRELDFNIDFSVSRRFEEYFESSTESVSFGQQLMDPLVINLDDNIASVSDQKFYFDLDSDGYEDEVTNISSGRGFLALDKNEDGIINNGSELFGTKSGDGFRDLAAYDSDNNGWIDENDEVFNKLKIMSFNEDGTNTLYTLKEKGVGAIYLGNTDTNYSLTDDKTNRVDAAIRKTGIFLYETGGVGTVQHVDLAVELGA